MNAVSKSSRTVFLETIENHAPEQWQTILDAKCGGDVVLRRQVRRLLDAHLSAGNFMQMPAAAPPRAAQSPTTCLGSTVGRYRLVEQIGEGGMGVVYVAEQLAPVCRRVALKIIKPGMDTRQVIARFDAERQALARMDHPNIARILDAGATAEDRPYFVMELVRGLPITDYCKQFGFSLRQRLELLVSVCQAVEHAHQKGIVHRDLKPSNVLVSSCDAESVVKVIDFGVAKAICEPLTDSSVYTGLSQFVGTPLYMSPEQAGLGNVDIDPRSDVYSLGVLLYELLTGGPGIDSETLRRVGVDEVRRRIREEDLPRPSQRLLAGDVAASWSGSFNDYKLGRALRGEIDSIVMKALEKDRARRYESASALAQDITRFLRDEPIQARPASWWLRAKKWRRRNPAAAIAAVGALVAVGLLASFAAFGVWHNHRLQWALALSDRLREEGRKREDTLRRELYTNEMRLAWQAASSGNVVAARELLDRHQPSPSQDHTGFEWHYLRRLTQPPLRTLNGHVAAILAADVSADGRWVASGDAAGDVRVWELDSGRLVKTWRYSEKEVTTVRFSPDCKLLATGGQDATARLWSVGDWSERAKLAGHQRTVTCVAWSPDGRWLATASRDQTVNIWNGETHRLEHALPKHGDVARVVLWSSDGRVLATADGAAAIRLFDGESWIERGFIPWEDPGMAILCLAFSPDNRFLASAGYVGALRLFDVQSLTKVAQAQGRQTWSLAFAGPDRIVAGSSDEGLLVWHFDQDRKELRPLRERTGGMETVRSCQFVQGRKAILTASEEDRVVAIWDWQALLGRRDLGLNDSLGVLGPNRGLSADPEDAVVVTDLNNGRELARLNAHWKECSPASATEGRLLALAEDERHISIIDSRTWQVRKRLSLPPGHRVSNLHFSADCHWLAAGCSNGISGYWNLQNGEWRGLHDTKDGPPGIVRFAENRNLLAYSYVTGNGIELWDLELGKIILVVHIGDFLHQMRFSRDDTQMIVAGRKGFITLFDTATGTRVDTLTGHRGAVGHLAVSPDGRTLASAGEDQTIRLWSLPSRRELFTLGEGIDAHWLDFLDDGSLAISHGPDAVLSIFERAAAAP